MVAYDICDENCEECPLVDICEKTVKSYKELLDEEIAQLEKNCKGLSPINFKGMHWPILSETDKGWILKVKVNKIEIKMSGSSKEDIESIWNYFNRNSREMAKIYEK